MDAVNGIHRFSCDFSQDVEKNVLMVLKSEMKVYRKTCQDVEVAGVVCYNAQNTF